MGDYLPVAPDGRYGYTCSAAVTEGQLLEVTGDGTVGPAAVTSAKVVGVAAFAQASGGKVLTHDLDDLHETTVATGQALTAGDPVKAGASGTVEKWDSANDAVAAYLGTCTTGATAGNKARWTGR